MSSIKYEAIGMPNGFQNKYLCKIHELQCANLYMMEDLYSVFTFLVKKDIDKILKSEARLRQITASLNSWRQVFAVLASSETAGPRYHLSMYSVIWILCQHFSAGKFRNCDLRYLFLLTHLGSKRIIKKWCVEILTNNRLRKNEWYAKSRQWRHKKCFHWRLASLGIPLPGQSFSDKANAGGFIAPACKGSYISTTRQRRALWSGWWLEEPLWFVRTVGTLKDRYFRCRAGYQ